MTDKMILDVTCGDRTIWFQKNEPHTIWMAYMKFDMIADRKTEPNNSEIPNNCERSSE